MQIVQCAMSNAQSDDCTLRIAHCSLLIWHWFMETAPPPGAFRPRDVSTAFDPRVAPRAPRIGDRARSTKNVHRHSSAPKPFLAGSCRRRSVFRGNASPIRGARGASRPPFPPSRIHERLGRPYSKTWRQIDRFMGSEHLRASDVNRGHEPAAKCKLCNVQ